MRNTQRGFTLIELMVVVAVVGILSAVAIPAFARSMKSGGYDSEARAVIGELLTKEQQFKIEHGRWKVVTACAPAPSDTGVTADSCMTAGGDWSELKVQSPVSKLRCTYQVATGCAADVALPPAGVTFQYGAESWSYVVAQCGVGNHSYTYFASSSNSTVQRLDGIVSFTKTIGCSTSSVPTGGTAAPNTGTGMMRLSDADLNHSN